MARYNIVHTYYMIHLYSVHISLGNASGEHNAYYVPGMILVCNNYTMSILLKMNTYGMIWYDTTIAIVPFRAAGAVFTKFYT